MVRMCTDNTSVQQQCNNVLQICRVNAGEDALCVLIRSELLSSILHTSKLDKKRTQTGLGPLADQLTNFCTGQA